MVKELQLNVMATHLALTPKMWLTDVERQEFLELSVESHRVLYSACQKKLSNEIEKWLILSL
jgi:hypothetical protein